MKNLANQVELFFVNPAVLGQKNTVMFGHFTSPLEIPNYSKSTLTISADSANNIVGIHIDEKITLTPSYDYYNNPELAFLNDMDLNGMLKSHQLQLYKSLFDNNIISEIMFLEVPELIKGQHSYVFFGYVEADHALLKEQHTKVFYTDNGEIKEGGMAPHETGSSISSAMHNNYAFGFGNNLKLNGTSTKRFLENNRKYLRFLSDPEKANTPETKKVFEYCMSDYLDYIVTMTEILDQKELDFRPFWQTKEVSDLYDSISEKVIKEMMVS